jgi:acyl-CoA reductase-like NAD-dependent aldehyde dehydrogenase
VAVDVPLGHRLWQHEMFLPITMIHPVGDLDEAMTLANNTKYGLTAGFYGSEEEVGWFYDNIEAGVVYANRPQGATTGAWPGYQPFGGWKGSGASGKNCGRPFLPAAVPARANSEPGAPVLMALISLGQNQPDGASACHPVFKTLK